VCDRVQTLFVVTGVDGMVPTYPTVEAAAAALKSKRAGA
jgi:hypothetical protein